MSKEEMVNAKVPRIKYRIEHISSPFDKDVFKFYVGDDEIYHILMRIGGSNIFPYDTKVKCLYNIFSHNSELLMLFLSQLESDGRL